MADLVVTMKDALRALDLLDGRRDGSYAGSVPLYSGATTAGTCFLEQARNGCFEKGRGCAVTRLFERAPGKWISVNCAKLGRMLMTLAAMGTRMPAIRLLSAGIEPAELPKALALLRQLNYDDFYGFHLVDHMILALLSGIATTDSSLFQLLASIPFREYNGFIQDYGVRLGRPEFRHREVTTFGRALVLLSALSRKYGFSIEPFTFKKILKGFKPE